MGRLKLTTEHKRIFSIVMAVVAVLMLADVVYQITMHVRWRWWIPSTLAAEGPTTQPAATQSAATQPDAKEKEKKKKTKKPKPPEVHAAIKKRNIFTKVKPKGHGLKLTGVIGSTALFADRKNKTVAIEEGKSGKGVKVKSISGYEVVIEYKGKTETMKLFGGKGWGGPPSPGGPPGRPGPPRIRGIRPSPGPGPSGRRELQQRMMMERLPPEARERMSRGRMVGTSRRAERN